MDNGLAELEWHGTCVCDGTRYGSDETVTIVRVKDENDAMAITDARALYDLFRRRSGAAGLCRRAQLDLRMLSQNA